MDKEKDVIELLSNEFTQGGYWGALRDVVWFKGDPNDRVNERFGARAHSVTGEYHSNYKPRFMNSILELIILAKETLDEDQPG